MRIFQKLPAACLAVAVTFTPSFHGQPASLAPPQISSDSPNSRVVLVLPFDNRSPDSSLNWVGDSFPDTLNHRLNSAGFLTISQDDRSFALTHLGLPVDFRPSRATAIRIAQQLDANFVITGNFTVTGDRIAIQARVLSINDLRLSPTLEDSADLNRLYDVENATAWKVARTMDPHFAVAEQTFVAAPGAVPLSAFENYIRGTDAGSPAERTKRLTAAVSVAPTYAAALLALGKNQYAARDYAASAATLAKVSPNDPLTLEANFYLGLSRFNAANYTGAATAFAFVADRLPLPEVLNDQAVALSRQNKDAVDLFRRASAADPSDEDYRYNLAVSLYRRGNTAGALAEIDTALKLKANDTEATELRTRLSGVSSGTKLVATGNGFSPAERIRRSYSEAGFRQASFQLQQLRAARMELLPPAQRTKEYDELGRESLAKGLLPEAETEFGAALAADPASADAHAGLAEIRERSGGKADARSEATASLKIAPTVSALLVLARLDLADNQLSASATNVSQALRLEPANVAAQTLRQTLQSRGQAVP